MEYKLLPVDQVQLDKDNPRIKHYIEMYGDENLTSEAISLALSLDDNGKGSSIGALKESIKSNKGIIQPILVNKTFDGKYVVIEGNTRVQIYREFGKNDPNGPWKKIISIVYDNLPINQIHAIRLQCHLVGARDWDPFSKAKYLNQLSNVEHLPLSEIVSYCGGKTNEVSRLIKAYQDMIQFYGPLAKEKGEVFDPKEFSKFSELQNKRIVDSLILHGYTKSDFAEWVLDGNIDNAQNVRKIPQILNNDIARNVFLKSNITDASKYIHDTSENLKKLEGFSMYDLAKAVTKKMREISFKEVERLQDNPDYENKKEILNDMKFELDHLIESIEK
jgi:hypothetical protein